LMALPFEQAFPTCDATEDGHDWARLLRQEATTHTTERQAVRKSSPPLRVRIRFSRQREAETGLPFVLAVVEDITELRRTEAALAEAQAARHEMARRLTTAQENERTRIARELHDHIGQSLAILRIQMMRSGQPVSGMPGQVHPGLPELSGKLKDIAAQVSRLSHQLHSSELEYLGFSVAVQSHCREFSAKFKIPVACCCEGIPKGIDNLLALSLLRVIQEALHNAAKYSHAESIEVQVMGSPSGIALRIADNGVGFDVEEARLAAGFGLISMRERIHLAGGEFAIQSRPGAGTTITARVPLASSDAA
jgi:signal transduction histidine kinase